LRHDVESLIQTGTSGNIAAFIAEPIQGMGASLHLPRIFQDRFQDREEIRRLFISDEVQTAGAAPAKSGSASSSGK